MLKTRIRIAPLAMPEPREPDYGLMVLGRLLGGVAGGIAGYYLSSSSDDLGTAYASIALGTLVGIPVGVHVGNSARGNGPLTVLAGFAAGVATLLIATGGGGGDSELVFAVPLTGAAAAIWVEGKTMR